MRQRNEEARIDGQLGFPAHRGGGQALEFGDAARVCGARRFDRGVKCSQQSKMADVADIDVSAIAHQRDGAPEDFEQVIDIREILRHRVQDDGIERIGSEVR